MNKKTKIIQIVVKAAISIASVLLGISIESFTNVSQLIM